jgi:sulfur carrier protein ThiS
MKVQVIASGYLRKYTQSDVSIASVEIEDGSMARYLVDLLLPPEEESFINVMDGTPVPFGHTLRQDDQARIIPPISGGKE